MDIIYHHNAMTATTMVYGRGIICVVPSNHDDDDNNDNDDDDDDDDDDDYNDTVIISNEIYLSATHSQPKED